MAAKKDKPALYELINSKEKVTTPSWFYKKTDTSTETVRKKIKVIPGTKKPNENGPGQPNSPAIPAVGISPPKDVGKFEGIRVNKAAIVRLADKKLKFSVSYWLVPLIALSLILTILVSYRLGQASITNGQQANNNELKDAPPDSQLKKVSQGPVQPGLAPKPAKNPGATTAKTVPTTPKTDLPGISLAQTVRSGQCFLLCGAKSRDQLVPVQKFFNERGLATIIGRRESRYVLTTSETFERQNSEKAKILKDKLVKLGESYYNLRPKNAPNYNPATFRSAYAVNVGSEK